VLDHGRMWLDQAGRHVLTGEPYDAALEDLVSLHTDLVALGLSATLTGRSPWNTDYTFLVIIRPAGT
jgi:hypothetical protein